MIIIDTYQYFPTIYPADLPTLIINSETLFGSLEAATGYDIWLNIQGNSKVQSVLEKLKSLALRDQLMIDVRENAVQQIQKLTDQPEWVGLFGILGVGFISSLLFVPLLQIIIAPAAPVQPFQVITGWNESVWIIIAFGLILLIAIIGMIGYII